MANIVHYSIKRKNKENSVRNREVGQLEDGGGWGGRKF